eukprot:7737882-Lingulodinium_polyedra.AAC.1
MLPGDVEGPGSHNWMMTAWPANMQEDWGLEVIGSMIKYPFVVAIFVQQTRDLPPGYSAVQL